MDIEIGYIISIIGMNEERKEFKFYVSLDEDDPLWIVRVIGNASVFTNIEAAKRCWATHQESIVQDLELNVMRPETLKFTRIEYLQKITTYEKFI